MHSSKLWRDPRFQAIVSGKGRGGGAPVSAQFLEGKARNEGQVLRKSFSSKIAPEWMSYHRRSETHWIAPSQERTGM